MRLLLAALFASALVAQQNVQQPYVPLTSSQRWDQYWHDTFLSPGLYFASLGAGSGMQLAHDPPEWGQGIRGYSKRAGTLLATFSLQTTVQEGGDAALGYDPRYTHCNCRGAGRRFGHAVFWSFLTKDDAGKTRFDIAGVAGAYAGGMIPILWYPDRFSPWKDGVRHGNQQLGFTVGINMIREFSPELRKIFHLKSSH